MVILKLLGVCPPLNITAAPKGPQGERGVKGEPGLPGRNGEKGDRGFQGEDVSFEIKINANT